MATGYKMIDGKLTAMKPNILAQYYGAGNLYMTTYDMVAHLVNNLKIIIFLVNQCQHH